MGLFKKKNYECERCGQTFSKRFPPKDILCEKCLVMENKERAELYPYVAGYAQYHEDVFHESYSADEMRKIIEHRNAIINKYRITDGISRSEIQETGNKYRLLTDDQAKGMLRRVSPITYNSMCGATYTESFFVLNHYSKVIIDAKDVFAVGILPSSLSSTIFLENNDCGECVVFTNDPYIPVFFMTYTTLLNLFDKWSVGTFFSMKCRNLTYEVANIEKIEKRIKNEHAVKGNPDAKFVLHQIYSSNLKMGIFESKKIPSCISQETSKMLEEMGYISEIELSNLLNMNKKPNNKYWTEQLQKL